MDKGEVERREVEGGKRRREGKGRGWKGTGFGLQI